ncbi:28S ribosomal protein S15, mitochondrial-like [Ceratina calcarata]|uniref:Small ribosomal subunit protein uS15m n=1 Tax=Ceratina calcarata TaxID=156304 RepID=A0AAJ7J7U5_9HYME|nr:28S ribosomal protein S15, mitochondrial-like [Ceratina calcarata]
MSLTIKCSKLLNSVNHVYKMGGYYACRSFITVEEAKNIKWYKPARVPHIDPRQTGDLGLEVNVKPTDTILYYKNSKELEDASDIVKKMFTVEYRGFKEYRNLKREEIINRVKRHVSDRGSVEVQIAAMTSEIQDLQKYMEVHPTDTKTKVFLSELIDKRKKYLKFLRNWDYRRFEWVLENLNLTYIGPPEYDTFYLITYAHDDFFVQFDRRPLIRC